MYYMTTIQKNKQFFGKVIFISLIFNIFAFSGCIDNYIEEEKIDDSTLTIGLGSNNFNIQYPFTEFLTE